MDNRLCGFFAVALCLGCCTRMPPNAMNIEAHPSDDDDLRAIRLVQEVLVLPDPEVDKREVLFSGKDEYLVEEIARMAGSGTTRYILDVAESCFDKKLYYSYGSTSIECDKQTMRMFACLRCLEERGSPFARVFEQVKQWLDSSIDPEYKWFMLHWVSRNYEPRGALPVLAKSLNDRRVCYPKIMRLGWGQLTYEPKNRICDFVYREMLRTLGFPCEYASWLDKEVYDKQLTAFTKWWNDNENRLVEEPDMLNTLRRVVAGIRSKTPHEQEALQLRDRAYREWLNLPQELAEYMLDSGDEKSKDVIYLPVDWDAKYANTPIEQIPLPDIESRIGE